MCIPALHIWRGIRIFQDSWQLTPFVSRRPLTQPCAVLASSWESRALKAEESARQHLVALIALSTGDEEAPGPESAETGSAFSSSTAGAEHCSAVVEALRRELSAAQDELDRERDRAVKLHSRLVSLEEHMVSHHCPMFSVACSL
jgi:hypothetical protein